MPDRRPRLHLKSFSMPAPRRFSIFVFTGLLAAIVPLEKGFAQTVAVDDDFDNGVVSSNPHGAGTGFNQGSVNSGADVSESHGALIFTTDFNGARRAYATSQTSAAIDLGSTFTRFDFEGLSFERNLANNGNGAADRLYLGIKGTSTASDMANNPDAGFYLQFESNSIPTQDNNLAWNGVSSLFYESSTNVRTQLATWTFDTLNWDDNVPANFNFTPTLNISLLLSSTRYALTISGDTINVLTGSLSGAFADIGVTNELTVGYGTIYQQIEAPGLVTRLDRYTATTGFVAVPEPSTYVLLGMGSLLALLTTRRGQRAPRARD